jgi:hypothetical protein
MARVRSRLYRHIDLSPVALRVVYKQLGLPINVGQWQTFCENIRHQIIVNREWFAQQYLAAKPRAKVDWIHEGF